ncbi:MAG: hypothetical protein VX730_09630 [Pseudomonadota bacterium]|nr:hypothetical protein [Pseudomonadota bacterium]
MTTLETLMIAAVLGGMGFFIVRDMYIEYMKKHDKSQPIKKTATLLDKRVESHWYDGRPCYRMTVEADGQVYDLDMFLEEFKSYSQGQLVTIMGYKRRNGEDSFFTHERA